MKPVLLGVRFLLELAALAILAGWGADEGVWLAAAAPLGFAVAWGLFVAPKAKVRLGEPARLAVEVALWAAAAAALADVWSVVAGVVFGGVAVAVGLVLRR